MSNVDRRRALRVSMNVSVSLECSKQLSPCCKTVDLSESGVFLLGGPSEAGVGDVVTLRINGILRDKTAAVPAQVVRRTGYGLALNFLH